MAKVLLKTSKKSSDHFLFPSKIKNYLYYLHLLYLKILLFTFVVFETINTTNLCDSLFMLRYSNQAINVKCREQIAFKAIFTRNKVRKDIMVISTFPGALINPRKSQCEQMVILQARCIVMRSKLVPDYCVTTPCTWIVVFLWSYATVL